MAAPTPQLSSLSYLPTRATRTPTLAQPFEASHAATRAFPTPFSPRRVRRQTGSSVGHPRASGLGRGDRVIAARCEAHVCAMKWSAFFVPPRPVSAGVFVAACALSALSSRVCLADGRRTHLDVARSAGASACPDAPTVAAAVTRALGRDALDTTSDAGATLRFDVAFAPHEAGYVATVRESGAHTGERTIAGSDSPCSDLTDALAVTITMMLESAEAEAVSDSRSAPAASNMQPSADPAADARKSTPAGPSRRDPEGRTAFNVVFAELLGSGVTYSINYERLLGDSNVSLRVGFSYARSKENTSFLSNDGQVVTDLSFPVLANYYVGSPSHKLQLGAGITVFYHSDPAIGFFSPGSFDPSGSPTSGGVDAAAAVVVGYRFIPRAGGPALGIAFTPLFGTHGVQPWAGINAGAVF
jgi:hypothetical protein